MSNLPKRVMKKKKTFLLFSVKNWNLFKTNLNTKDFKSVLITIQEVNYELLQKRRKEEGLSEAVDSIEVFIICFVKH